MAFVSSTGEKLEKVIWERAFSSMSAETINIDASEYKYYEVIYRGGSWEGCLSTGKIPLGTSTYLTRIVFDSSSNNWYFGRRDITVSSNKITIGDVLYGRAAEVATANNSMCVPIKIIVYK